MVNSEYDQTRRGRGGLRNFNDVDYNEYHRNGGAKVADTKPIRFTAAVTKEGEWYVARCLEIEVTSQGDTLENALGNLQEAIELYL